MLKMLKWSDNEIPQLASALFATGSVSDVVVTSRSSRVGCSFEATFALMIS